MTKAKVCILRAPGTNCDLETKFAVEQCGAKAEIIHINKFVSKEKDLLSYHGLIIPGGFSYGDHVRSGAIMGKILGERFGEEVEEFAKQNKPILGICNGFQVLVNTGLLPGTLELESPNALLDMNKSSVFESRWVDVFVQESNCIWTQGLAGEKLRIPVAHGEGRLIVPEDFDDKLTVLRYGSEQGTEEYPDNPNGSELGRAGICDPSGLIFGLMPHPERAIYPWLGSDHGIKIFKAGIKAVL